MPKLLRNSKDWISLAHITLVLGSMGAFLYLAAFTPLGWRAWPLAVVAALTGIYTNYVAHNHSHVMISEIPAVNNLLDQLLGFTSGTPLLFWRLHHVENHHRYEGTARDWSWNFGFQGTRFPDKPVSVWYYSLSFTPLVFCEVTTHVLRRPFSKVFKTYFVSLGILLAANLTLIMLVGPWYWMASIGVIYLLAPFFLGFANYFHHYGCPDRRGVRAANTFINDFHNGLSYNIGYHIEHSMKPKMHWSELPAFFREHRHEIPDAHVTTFFPGVSAMWEVPGWLKKRAAAADFSSYKPQPSPFHHVPEEELKQAGSKVPEMSLN